MGLPPVTLGSALTSPCSCASALSAINIPPEEPPSLVFLGLFVRVLPAPSVFGSSCGFRLYFLFSPRHIPRFDALAFVVAFVFFLYRLCSFMYFNVSFRLFPVSLPHLLATNAFHSDK
jgi:hypothetical protein